MHNWHRPHAALGSGPSISRLRLERDKLSRLRTYALAENVR